MAKAKDLLMTMGFVWCGNVGMATLLLVRLLSAPRAGELPLAVLSAFETRRSISLKSPTSTNKPQTTNHLCKERGRERKCVKE